MITAAVYQALFKLTLAFFGIALAWLTLRFLDDHIEGDSFADSLKQAAPADKMRYFAFRFLGVCVLVGLVIS
jgi:hypothetical protein